MTYCRCGLRIAAGETRCYWCANMGKHLAAEEKRVKKLNAQPVYWEPGGKFNPLDYSRAYHASHQEERKAKAKAYYAANKERWRGGYKRKA